ncbi:MAG: hypothetical protein COX52_05745 [Syntrophobacterales bacterium CG23_combo_of_CG06-09_8_20_14_all_48_27]|nr:MAG: hypothetical protein COX52_05745 [Syntrophobacterales bacterium CG23_combo_of_CG06-09_8_20_14_all_48_27]
MVMMMVAILLAAAYIAGSVNFSILLFRLLGREDPRDHFSRNAGVTNVYRQAGYFWAAVVLILDVAKALLIGAAASYLLDQPLVPWVGLSLVIGNRFSCFHGFHGGKGVTNYLGFTASLSPLTSILSCVIWVLAYSVFRIPFVASFFMILTLAAGTVITYSHTPVAVSGVLMTVLLIFYYHKRNIMLLIEKRKGKNEN